MSSVVATPSRTALAAILALVAGCVSQAAAPPTTATTVATAPDTTTTTMTTIPTTTTTAGPTTTTAPLFNATVTGVDAEMLGHSWQQGCPVGPEDLRLIVMHHWGFDDVAHTGSLVVHESHVTDVIEVFRALYDARYPIQSMVPIGELPEGAEDLPGYENTSALHCRPVKGSTGWSQHAYGRAIDLNPHLNPYIRGDEIWPVGSERYTDRGLAEPGMIIEGDVVVTAFDGIGWGWGGRWRTLKDYHHFSSTGR